MEAILTQHMKLLAQFHNLAPIKRILQMLPLSRLALLMVLAAHQDGGVVPLGVECSTYVFMSRGTTKRSVLLPMGYTVLPKIAAANMYASRKGLRNDSDVANSFMHEPFKCLKPAKLEERNAKDVNNIPKLNMLLGLSASHGSPAVIR